MMNRPRNKKKRVTVAVACESCHKSKRTCSSFRPCARCVRLGKGDQCVDHCPPNRSSQRSTPPISPVTNGALASPAPAAFGVDRPSKRLRTDAGNTLALPVDNWQLDSPDSVLTLSPRAEDALPPAVDLEKQQAELRYRLDQLPLIQVPAGVDPTSFRFELVRLLARDALSEYRGLLFCGMESFVHSFVPFLDSQPAGSPSLARCVDGAEMLATVLVRANFDTKAVLPPARAGVAPSKALSRWMTQGSGTPSTFIMFDCSGDTWKPALPMANDALSALLGFAGQELSGALTDGSHMFVYPEDVIRRAIAIVEMISQRAEAGSHQHRLVQRSGHPITVVESWKVDYCAAKGLPVSMTGTFSVV